MKAMRLGFADRAEAGRQLGRLLLRFATDQPFVIAVARGGLPVGYEVARALRAPLEAIAVRKLIATKQGGGSERPFGAVAEGGVFVPDTLGCDSLVPGELEALRALEEDEIGRRAHRYRGDRALPSLAGRTAIVVDDGVVTGLTALAALAAVRRLLPRRTVLAVPVGSFDVVGDLRSFVDEVVCVEIRLALWAIGLSYGQFDPIDDDHVVGILERAEREHAAESAPS